MKHWRRKDWQSLATFTMGATIFALFALAFIAKEDRKWATPTATIIGHARNAAP